MAELDAPAWPFPGLVQAEAARATLVRQGGQGPVWGPNSCWSPALRRKRDRLKPGLQLALPPRNRHLDLNHALSRDHGRESVAQTGEAPSLGREPDRRDSRACHALPKGPGPSSLAVWNMVAATAPTSLKRKF